MVVGRFGDTWRKNIAPGANVYVDSSILKLGVVPNKSTFSYMYDYEIYKLVSSNFIVSYAHFISNLKK